MEEEIMGKKTTAKATTTEQINVLTTAKLLKMDVGKFWLMRERADEAGRKRLDFLFQEADLEYKIRRVCQEEIAKASNTKRMDPPAKSKKSGARVSV